MRRSCSRILVLLAGGVASTPALAADPTAEALFQAGVEAFDRGETDVACAKLAESQKLEPLPGTSYRLGICEEKRGRLASAWVAYEECQQRLPAGDQRRPLVEAKITALSPRLPRLIVELASGVASDAVVMRDGRAFGDASIGVALPVDPGTHTFRITAPGHAERTFAIAIAEGDRKTLTLDLGPPLPHAERAPGTSVTPPPPTETEGGLSPVTIAGFPVIGVGVVAMGVGVALGFVAKARYDDAAVRCPAGSCDRTGFDERNDARTLGDAGTGVFIAGAGVAAVGVVLCIVGAATRSASREEALRFEPVVGEGTLGGGLRGHF